MFNVRILVVCQWKLNILYHVPCARLLEALDGKSWEDARKRLCSWNRYNHWKALSKVCLLTAEIVNWVMYDNLQNVLLKGREVTALNKHIFIVFTTQGHDHAVLTELKIFFWLYALSVFCCFAEFLLTAKGHIL